MATRGLHIGDGHPVTVTVAAEWFTDAGWVAAVGPSS
jgi:hypothetical protein